MPGRWALHQIGDPLVLVNVWDAESARRVERSGGRGVAMLSAAVAASLGLADGNTMPPAAAFMRSAASPRPWRCP